MVVCRYFQNGYCRYGNNCRFEHVRAPERYYDARESRPDYDPYTYSRFDPPRQQRPMPPMQRQPGNDSFSTLSDYLDLIIREVREVEKGHMWELTCAGFLKGHGNIPGWEDYSPEEIRHGDYEAGKQGPDAFDRQVTTVKNLLRNAREARNVFHHPSRQAEATLQEYLKQSSSESESQRVSSTFQTFSFARKQPDAAQSSSSFAQKQPDVAQSSSSFALPTSIFGQTQQQSSNFSSFSFARPSNTFGSATTNQPSVFASPKPSFFPAASSTPTQSFFSSNSTPFGKPQDDNNNCIYSSLASLTDKQRIQFEAQSFQPGLIPIVPPPIEMCD